MDDFDFVLVFILFVFIGILLGGLLMKGVNNVVPDDALDAACSFIS